MERTEVNPWEWSKAFGFSQALELKGVERLLVCSGQTAMGPDGSPPSTSDMAEQVKLATANLETVLTSAGMGLDDIVKVTIFTTDVDEFLGAYENAGAIVAKLPAVTLVGVTRLAFPELKVEIEATAAR